MVDTFTRVPFEKKKKVTVNIGPNSKRNTLISLLVLSPMDSGKKGWYSA